MDTSELRKAATELIDKATENNLPIVMDKHRELFGAESDHLVLVLGAITTEARFQRFTESLAHLQQNGDIMRHGVKIGDVTDIKERG